MAKQVTMLESIVQGPLPVGGSEAAVERALDQWNRKTEQDLTGIFIPDGFAAGASLDLVVYFHGLLDRCGGAASDTVEQYWTNPHFRLREWVNDSKKNVVLVVPRLSFWDEKTRSKLGMDGDAFLTAVQKAVSERLKKDPFNRTGGTTIRNIYLAAHSGGGTTMLWLARTLTVGKVLECWGFDSMYSNPQDWVNWAAKGGKYFQFWTDDGGIDSDHYGNNVSQITKILSNTRDPTSRLAAPNVVIEYAPKPKKFSPSTKAHCEVPQTYFPELMKRLP